MTQLKLTVEICSCILEYVKSGTKITKETVNLKETFMDVISIFNSEISRKRKVNVITEISPKAPGLIVSDGVKIRQILINLVSNALKYTEKGMISILLSLGPEYQKSQLVKISVKDTGLGIRDEDKKVLFKEFGTLRNNKDVLLNRNGVGLGINLSNELSKLLIGYDQYELKELGIENQGLQLESEYKKGSTFSFYVKDFLRDDHLQHTGLQQTKTLPYNAELLNPETGAQPGKSRFYTVDQLREPYLKDFERQQDRPNSPEKQKALKNQRSFVSVSSSGLGLPKNRSQPIMENKQSGFTKPKKERPKKLSLKSSGLHGFEKPKENSEEAPSDALSSLRFPRVLVVDDNDFNLRIIKENLRKLKIECDCFISAQIALEKLKKHHQTPVKICSSCSKVCQPYGMILTDLHMPFMGGYEFLTELKKEGSGFEAIPVVCVTGDILVDPKYEKFDSVASKPLGIKDLQILVSTHLKPCSRVSLKRQYSDYFTGNESVFSPKRSRSRYRGGDPGTSLKNPKGRSKSPNSHHTRSIIALSSCQEATNHNIGREMGASRLTSARNAPQTKFLLGNRSNHGMIEDGMLMMSQMLSVDSHEPIDHEIMNQPKMLNCQRKMYKISTLAPPSPSDRGNVSGSIRAPLFKKRSFSQVSIGAKRIGTNSRRRRSLWGLRVSRATRMR